MKRTLTPLCMILAVASCVQSSLYAQKPEHLGGTKGNLLLHETDIVGFQSKRLSKSYWAIGMEANGKPREVPSLEQQASYQGIGIRIKYAEFGTSDEAHKAILFHVNDIAVVMRPGYWDVAGKKTIGDETWSVFDETSAGLLLRSGKVCILVSCYDGDNDKRRRIAELVARRIVEKAGKGHRLSLDIEH